MGTGKSADPFGMVPSSFQAGSTCSGANKTSRHLHLGRCGCAIFLLLLSWFEEAQALTKFYNIGNSFSDHIAGTPNIALSLGETFDWGRHMIPGASLSFIWSNPTSGFQSQGYYPSALTGKAWDFVSLQPWGGTVASNTTAAIDFAALAFQGNPGARVVVLATSSFSLLPTSPAGAFHAAFENADSSNTGSRAFFEALVNNLKAAYPGKGIGLIPVQHVLAELDRRLAAGESIPEITSITDVLDETNHFNARGRYLASLATFATVMRRSPVGALSGNFYGSYSVTPDFAAYAQALVWEVVQSEPLTVLATGNGVPKARFSSSALRGMEPWQVTFNGSASSDADGELVSYEWNFGDGTSASGISVQKNFVAGVYRVTLTVTDNDGLSAATSRYVEVSQVAKDPIALEAEAGEVGAHWVEVIDPNASLGRALTPAPGFNNTSNTTPPGAPADRVRFSFTVPSSGSYTIHARVNAPTTSDDSFWVRVNGGAWFAWNNIGNGTSAYLWSKMPGTFSLPSGPATIDIAYREDGTVLDKLQLSLGTQTPTGLGLPGVNVFYDDQPPSVPAGITATALKVNGVMLSWQPSSDNVGVFGYEVFRNNISVGRTATNSLGVEGLAPGQTYEFTVRAWDAAENVSEKSTPIVVSTPNNQAPSASISASPLKGPAPLTVTFSGAASNDPDPGDLVIGYDWDFGDGNTGGSFNEIVHTFSRPGLYRVRLTVIDLFGLANTTTLDVRVTGDLALREWREVHFGSPASEGNGADRFDADQDGLPNLVEYAVGSVPVDSANSRPPRLMFENGEYVFRFHRVRGELDYLVMVSSDLKDWELLIKNPEPFGEEVRVVVPPGDKPSRFVRLVVELAE